MFNLMSNFSGSHQRGRGGVSVFQKERVILSACPLNMHTPSTAYLLPCFDNFRNDPFRICQHLAVVKSNNSNPLHVKV